MDIEKATFTLGELAAIVPKYAEHFVLHLNREATPQEVDALQIMWPRFMPGKKLLVFQPSARLSVILPNEGAE